MLNCSFVLIITSVISYSISICAEHSKTSESIAKSGVFLISIYFDSVCKISDCNK